LLGDHAKQRGLAGAVRPDDADNAAGRQLESEIVDEQIVAEAFLEMLEVDDRSVTGMTICAVCVCLSPAFFSSSS
jgi:hypothetical protein